MILVVLAAGMGSRYGGLKQMEPVGPGGEALADYAVFDALRAGYDKAVFVIRREHQDTFREVVGDRIARHIDVEYAFQDPDDLPAPPPAALGRTKPWGTAHAVYAARTAVDGPFAVINADDFYGAGALGALRDHLAAPSGAGPERFAMAGFTLANTLSPAGPVARGLCSVGPDGTLRGVTERTQILRRGAEIQYADGDRWVTVPADTTVSMNCWGFTPGIFAMVGAGFGRFFADAAESADAEALATAEYLLPEVVERAVTAGAATVRVLPVADQWYGVTYHEDRAALQEALRDLVARGLYPERLWS